MAQTNFTLLVNLSNFFNDHRKIARIFVGEKVTTIQCIQNKIAKVFGVDNFVLLSNNEYLPPSEDIRILRKDDIIWAIPAKSGDLSYEHRDVENIEYSPTKLKKTKRKSNSADNETHEYVSKKKKQETYSADTQIDCVREKPSKSDAKTKVTTEEMEGLTKSSKKKKKTHKYEEVATEEIEDLTKSSKKKKNTDKYEAVQPEDEYSPKISKKNKYKDVEQTGSTCTKKIQKQIENSKKRNFSESNKYNYLEKTINEYQVTVGNSLPENVSFKKYTQIPTITDEYLKEKKINIVKIDYVSKPPAVNQIEASSADKIEISPIQNGSGVKNMHYLSVNGPLRLVEQNEAEIPDNSSNFIETKSSSIESYSGDKPTKFSIMNTPLKQKMENTFKQIEAAETKSNSIKSGNGVEKTTKFFFLNTPLRPKIIKPAKQKRSNVFKLNISPIVFKNKTKEVKLTEEKRNNMFQLGLSPVATKDEIETSCEIQEEKTATKPKTNVFKLDASPLTKKNNETCVDVIENVTDKNENIADEKMQVTENIAPPNVLINRQSVEVSPSIYIQDTYIIPDPTTENVEISQVSGRMECNGNSLALIRCPKYEPISQISSCITTTLDTPVNGETSQASGMIDCSMEHGIANSEPNRQISSCITTPLDTPVSDLGISGIEFINHGKYSARKQISGVGHLLDSIRQSGESSIMNDQSSCAILDASSNGDVSKFVTRRKRTRRTRSHRKKNKSMLTNTSMSPINCSISNTPRPMLTEANPKLHIKFSEDGENIENSTNDWDADSVISIGDASYGDLQLVEENILKAPLMFEMPKIGNIISFKILKITDNFTPEVSSYIIGRIVDFSENSKLVVLEITYGLEEFEGPRGKFSMDEKEKRSMSIFKECLWSDLLEPRLIDP